MDCTGQGSRVDFYRKIKTKHSIKGSLDSEFPSICNLCGVMAVWSRKTLNMFEKFLRFLKKTIPYSKLFKILSQKVLLGHQSACCVQISWNLADGKSVKSCVAYLIKNNISSGSPAVAAVRIAPKIYQGQPPTLYPECSRFHPNRFTFGGVIAGHMNTAKTCHKVNPIFDWNLASSRTIKKLKHIH